MTNDIIAELISAWKEIALEMSSITVEVRKAREELEKWREIRSEGVATRAALVRK